MAASASGRKGTKRPAAAPPTVSVPGGASQAEHGPSSTSAVKAPRRDAFATMMRRAALKPLPVWFALDLQEGAGQSYAWTWRLQQGKPPAHEQGSWNSTVTSLKPVKGVEVEGIALHLTTNVPPHTDPPQGCYKPQLAPSLLKSILQKCVRRKKVRHALAAATQLFHLHPDGPTQLVRRLQVIAVEDSTAHAASPVLAWAMLALAQGYVLPPAFLHLLLAVAGQVAACPTFDDGGGVTRLTRYTPTNPPAGTEAISARLSVPPLGVASSTAAAATAAADSGTDAKDVEAALSPLDLLQALHTRPDGDKGSTALGIAWGCLLRARFGGMAGDMQMLRQRACAWLSRALAPTQATPPPAGASQVSVAAAGTAAMVATFKHSAQALASSPGRAAWTAAVAASLTPAVDMHNQGRSLIPSGTLREITACAGPWAPVATAGLEAGYGPSTPLRDMARELLWCTWSGYNVRCPDALTRGLSPAQMQAAEVMKEVFTPLAGRCIKANAWIPV